MAAQQAEPKRGMSRRQFLTLAGAGAVVGAFILFATRSKGISGLLKTSSQPANPQTNRATAGRYISTRTASSPVTSQSFLSKLLDGKL